MKYLLLLVVSVVTVSGAALKEGAKELAERIFRTEQECTNLKKLKKSQSTPYTDLLTICEESLNQDKYAYIDQNSVDLSQYSEDKFPVTTGQGEELVKKPPKLSTEEMREKTKDFEGKKSTLAKRASKRAQEIVDQQVKCALAESKDDDDDCTKTLNCKKDKFLADEKLALKENSDSFPITYKGKETKINSPPDAVRDCATDADSTAATSKKSKGKAATAKKDKQEKASKDEKGDENEFPELNDEETEAPRRKNKGSSKMVTKGALDDLVMSAVSKGLGLETNDNSMMGNLVSLATPYLSDVMSGGALGALGGSKPNVPAPSNNNNNLGNNILSQTMGGSRASLTSLNSNHINSLMKVATNRLKRKEQREKVNREDLRAAIEIVTKTVMHFIIVTAQVKSNFGANAKGNPSNPLIDNLKVALMDTVAAFLVNFLIDKFLPSDEFLTVNDLIYANQNMIYNYGTGNQYQAVAQTNPKPGFLGKYFS